MGEVEHFHMFIYGKEFTLITYHKPLQVIYDNRHAKVSAGVERWILRMQPYTFKVVYRWNSDIKPFRLIKDELTVTNKGIILRGSKIVIPETLEQEAIDIAHESHLGISKTKALMRKKIWFPNMDRMVQDTLDNCISCQAVVKPKPPEPLSMTDMPTGPWQVLHVDFYGPLPSGDYLLVAIDRYSRHPEVEIVSSTKASLVIPKLDKMFATHDIPEVIKSNNRPPFDGEEYTRYLKALGINPKFSTPYWPQGNAEVERFMQPLGKAIKTTHAQGKPWKRELNRFLLQYRTAPHTTTKTPPAELLFNGTVKGKLPVLRKQNVVNKHKQAQENEKQMQRYNKQYVDTRRNVKMQNIQVGDCVLVRQPRQNKPTSTFSRIPYTVIRK